MSKISLNPKYTNNSGNSWSTTTYNSLEYHISTNKYSSTASTLKCEFTTPYDNIDVVVEIGSSSENNFDWCYIGNLDNSSPSYNSNYLDRISGYIGSSYSPTFKKITINVAKAGTHFLIIGYGKDGSGSYGNDCGYFRLVTTEVDGLKHDPYIYCGTKTTVVSEEPIKFTKTNVSYGSGGQRNWSDYEGTSKDYLWLAATGDDGYKTAKISFTTLSDNTIVTLKYDVLWRFTDERFTVSELDSTNSFVSENGPCSKIVTKEITVPKAGEHFITIGYKSSYFNNTHAYVGFFGTNVVTNTRTLVPESIFANNRDIDKVYVGSELIWSKSILNTISWETLTWDKSNNSYTYNTKGKLYISYSYGNNNYETYLLSSPASVPHPDEITKVKFYNINSYQGNSYNCTYKLDLSLLNTYKFNNMDDMFINCSSITSLDVSKLDTSNVTSMRSMFSDCRALTSLDVSNWNVGNVTNMISMFDDCSALASLDVSKWNVSSVNNMHYMFNGCRELNSLGISNCNVGNVTSMNFMFSNCRALTSLDVSKWNVGNVTNMHSMFDWCGKLASLDVSNWNVDNVNYMDYMFRSCSALTSLDVSKWNVGNVTNMGGMFNSCRALTSLDVSNWNVSSVTRMNNMFGFCSRLTSLDVSNWNVGNVTNMSNMFNNCSGLTSLIDGHESEPNVVALNGLKVSIDLHYSTKLNYESVYALFRGVVTVTTTQTITLPKVIQDQLDADKVKIATDKGWTVAYK